jgi:hypothetical protein
MIVELQGKQYNIHFTHYKDSRQPKIMIATAEGKQFCELTRDPGRVPNKNIAIINLLKELGPVYELVPGSSHELIYVELMLNAGQEENEMTS